MEDDLSDVGLNALEALEAQDEQEQNNSEPDTGEEDKGVSETEDTSGETDDKENEPDEGSEEDTSADEDGDEKQEDTDTEDSEDTEPEKKEEDKELSDEEFEEMAKKRGYAKAKTEEEKTTEDENAKTVERLLARPKEIDEEVWNELPDENKVIYNALPYLTAEGKKGVVQVKTPDQLPDGFEFKDQKAMMKFQNDLQAQETRANQFKQAIEARAEREQRAERTEAQKVIGEIDALQKSGELPSPKAKQGTKEFDDDPAVVLINKVLGYRVQRAQQGTHLSVRDSLLLYKAEHPEEFKQKEARGDIERRNIAKKVAGSQKATKTAVNGNEEDKPHYYKAGMSTEDVLDAVLNDMD